MEDFIKGLEELTVKVDKILAVIQPQKNHKNDLYKALSQAQSEYDVTKFSGKNDYFKDKYATLSDLVACSRASLTKHGLNVYHIIEQDEDDNNYLVAVLAHTSGQTLQSRIRLVPPKNTVAHIGSYIAHMKRITYASLVGVMVHDIDDDDGVLCMEEFTDKVSRGTDPAYTSKDTQSASFKRISKDQLEVLSKSMRSYHDLGKSICDHYNLRSLSDLPEEKFEAVLGTLRKNVAQRDGLL